MSKYFTEVDVSDIEATLEPPKKAPAQVFNEEAFKKALGRIEGEMEKIKYGNGELTNKAIFQDKLMPVEMCFDRLKKSPTVLNLDEFVAIAAQDYGKKVGDGFREWLEGCFEEEKDE
jgi:hypothetical protein